jgi:CheY-like chemotaxis protein
VPLSPDRVRVMVVDDSPDIRMMLRLMLGRDERFHLVGEAADGVEAVEMAGELRPDLVILDRQMPRLGGIEAIPLIRQAAPGTDIVLYTAAGDEDSHRAATAAGALGLLEKQTMALGLVNDLVDLLISRWGDQGAEVEVRVGPVASASARLWLQNTTEILEALRAHPEVVGRSLPDHTYERFRSLLDIWSELARDTDVFVWVGRSRPEELEGLVEDWAFFDGMSDQQVAALGCHWSDPAGELFFSALTHGVIEALNRHGATRRLAQQLSEGPWAGRTGAPPAAGNFS